MLLSSMYKNSPIQLHFRAKKEKKIVIDNHVIYTKNTLTPIQTSGYFA